jgi:hypothetical protein
MPFCTYTDVRRIIDTGLEDADITSLIIQADAEITERDIDGGANIEKTISALITASLIGLKDPKSRGAGEYSESTRDPQDWRNQAEILISRINAPTGRRG